MAEAVAPRQRHDEPADVASAAPAARSLARLVRFADLRRIVLAAAVVGLTVFLLSGAVRVGAGNWFGRRMSVRQIWTRFLDYLTELGASPVVVAAVAGAAIVALVAAACALWLALSLEDASSAESDRDAA